MYKKAKLRVKINSVEETGRYAEITIENREDCYYVTWVVTDQFNNKHAGKSFPISFRIIDPKIPIEIFLQEFISKNIEGTRSDRNRLFEIAEWEWV